MPRRSLGCAVLLPLVVALTSVSPASAQQGRTPRGGAGTTPTLPQAPAAPTAPVQLPAPPSVNDPMLAPLAPAAKNVATWDDILGHMRARSVDLRIAYGEVRRAENQWRIALAGALPSLNGQAVLKKELLTNTTTTPAGVSITAPVTDVIGTGSLILAQPLFAPRAWYGIKTADYGEDVARLSVEQTKRDITVKVASAVIAVVTAERVAELNRIGLRASLERLDLTSRKKALGAATGLDVLRAQQDAESARATLVSGDESLRQAREALGLALGLAEPVGVAANVSLDGLEKTATNVCKPAATIDERADVATARARIALAERGIGDAKWAFSPTIEARSTLATTTADMGIQPNTTWNIQGILSVPLWEGGARYGVLRNAHVDVERAETTLEGVRRGVEIEVAQARRAVEVADQSRKVAADARTLAAEADRLTRAGYLEGQGTSLELVVAAQGLRQAEVNLALKEFDLVRARIQALLSASNCPF